MFFLAVVIFSPLHGTVRQVFHSTTIVVAISGIPMATIEFALLYPLETDLCHCEWYINTKLVEAIRTGYPGALLRVARDLVGEPMDL